MQHDFQATLHKAVTSAAVEQMERRDKVADPAEIEVLARDLVRRAWESGSLNAMRTESTFEAFASGNTAQLVARASLSASLVVKVDDSIDILREAQLLQRFRMDPSLPAATRLAFPQVFAVSDESGAGSLFGYLMENVSGGGAEELSVTLQDRDRAEEVAAVLSQLWHQILAPAYEGPSEVRLLAVPAYDYVSRVRVRLRELAEAHPIFGERAAVRIIRGDDELTFEDGWGPELDAAEKVLVEKASGVPATFIHGDPNPENVIWRRGDADVEIRLLDPKAWALGDYVFDLAKLVHYLAVTSPVERHGVRAQHSQRGGVHEIQYDRGRLDVHLDHIALLRTLAAVTAQERKDQDWKWRSELAIGGCLLGIVATRFLKAQESGQIATGDQSNVQESLALIALGEGLAAIQSGVRQANA